jgi:hypothetical protein
LLVHGGGERHGAPAQFRARLVPRDCELNGAEKQIPSPPLVYYLALDDQGPVLFELDGNSDGIAIRNRWSDATGQHFFVWISGGPAFEFSFPREPGEIPERLIYLSPYDTAEDDHGQIHPVGKPAGHCDLVPGEPPPRPPPVALHRR